MKSLFGLVLALALVGSASAATTTAPAAGNTSGNATAGSVSQNPLRTEAPTKADVKVGDRFKKSVTHIHNHTKANAEKLHQKLAAHRKADEAKRAEKKAAKAEAHAAKKDEKAHNAKPSTASNGKGDVTT